MNRSSLALAAAALVTLAGCGGNSGSGGNPSRSGVVALEDNTYCQFEPGNYGAEGSNVEAVLGNGTDLFGVTGLNGLSVPFTHFATANTPTLRDAIAGKKTLVIPEQENRSWAGDLDFDGITALREFVNSGGTIIVFANYGGAIDLADAVLGSALQITGASSTSGTRTAAAAGTPFASGPDTLMNNNGSVLIVKDSLPPGSTILYDDLGDALIAVIPKGSGHVFMFSWDFYMLDPSNEASNWVDAFEIALTKY